MKKFTKVALSVMLISSTLIISSCSKSTPDTPVASTEPVGISDEQKKSINEYLDKYLPVIESESELPQLSEVKDGETIAVLSTNFGDVTMRFFPEQAPKAVENFVTLAQQGYYNGISFHRVINDFMIQGGDPTGTGTGGESIYGGKFDDEISPYLKHFQGAVAYANSGPNTNGSQFYIVENDKLSDDYATMLKTIAEDPKGVFQVEQTTGTEILNERYCSPVVAKEYLTNGGTQFLDNNYTIFGQVIEGMDIVHNIAEVKTLDGSGGTQADKPVEDVIINTITITEYKK